MSLPTRAGSIEYGNHIGNANNNLYNQLFTLTTILPPIKWGAEAPLVYIAIGLTLML
jgi:hypothetical protein